MTGEHFDGIWTYINELPQIYDRRQKLTEGLSRDLIYAVGTSLGFYLNDRKSFLENLMDGNWGIFESKLKSNLPFW